jgi:hypothetical protein
MMYGACPVRNAAASRPARPRFSIRGRHYATPTCSSVTLSGDSKPIHFL